MDDKEHEDDLLQQVCVPSSLVTATTIKMDTATNNNTATWNVLNYSDNVEHTSQYKEAFIRYNKKDGNVIDLESNSNKSIATIRHNKEQEVIIDLVINNREDDPEATTSPKSLSFQTTLNCRSLETNQIGRLYIIPMDGVSVGCCCMGGGGGGGDERVGVSESTIRFNIWLQEPITKEEQQRLLEQRQAQGKHPGITPKQRRPRTNKNTFIAECFQSSSNTKSIQMEFYDNNNGVSSGSSTSKQQTQQSTIKLLSVLLMIAYVDSK